MPTPLMPDEEFDAQFRQGLERYPEQPEIPAAWHRMELLLDADVRQKALRRKVLRLLGAETVLLLLGVWATLSLGGVRPPAAGNSPGALASTTRLAAPATTSAEPIRAAATATYPLTSEKTGFLAPASLPPQPPASAPGRTQPSVSPVRTTNGHSLAYAQATPPHCRLPTNSPGAVALLPARTSARRHTPKNPFSGAIARARRGVVALAATRRRPRAAAPLEKRSPLLAQSARVRAKIGFRQPLGSSAAEDAATRSAATSQTLSLHLSRPAARSWHHPSGAATRSQAAASLAANAPRIQLLPNDLLAPHLPTSDLSWRRPDSLALVALALPARPADSLAVPQLTATLAAYRLRVAVVAAPVLSTVRADRLTAPGSNLGVQLDYQLGRRWRISAGYLYTVSRYLARGTDYHLPIGYMLPHGWVISNVDAVCRIIDIPLNLRYDLWQRPRYQVFASVGLSSLLMRREQYTYDYEPSYGQPVPSYSWELSNGSQHPLQILNLSAGYERAVGPRWTVQAEPFVKLPLGGVGYGAVRLSSAGLSFSLKYGLFAVPPVAPH